MVKQSQVRTSPFIKLPSQELLMMPFAPRLVVSAALRCGAHARALQFLEEDLIEQAPSDSDRDVPLS